MNRRKSSIGKASNSAKRKRQQRIREATKKQLNEQQPMSVSVEYRDMTNQNNNQILRGFPDNSEPIAIDSDSDDSTDTASNQEVIGDEDSNSNSNSNNNSNVVQQGTKSSTADKTTEDLTRQELKKLSLDAHGTFMADFDPEKSKREIRKMNRRLNAKGSKRMRLYNEKGELLESLLDICDCLDTNCAGCHFPCPRCNSSKCGTDCRCNRKYTINLIEVEGTDKTFSFSIEPDENKKATV